MPAGSQRAFNSSVKASRSVTLLAAASIKEDEAGGGGGGEEGDKEVCRVTVCTRSQSQHRPPKKTTWFFPPELVQAFAKSALCQQKDESLLKKRCQSSRRKCRERAAKQKPPGNFRYGRRSSGSVYLPAALLIASNKPACHFAMGYLGETDKNHKLTNTCDTRRAI